MTGEEDAVTGPEVGRDLAAGIPGARFLLVEEAGHLVNLEQPEIVNEALWTPSPRSGSEEQAP